MLFDPASMPDPAPADMIASPEKPGPAEAIYMRRGRPARTPTKPAVARMAMASLFT